jgi:hypothetical protein
MVRKDGWSIMNDPSPYRYASDKIGFYIAANDQEILAQVNRLMTRSGFVGIMDTAGRLQYVLDGRRGTPYVAKRIIETAGMIMREHSEEFSPLLACLSPAADLVLAGHDIAQELKGYHYLRYILLLVGLDENRLRPISKNLYPTAATFFRVNVSQIERDVRYALQKTDFRQLGLTTAASICRLHNEMLRLAEELLNKEMPPASRETDRGQYWNGGGPLAGLPVADHEGMAVDGGV